MYNKVLEDRMESSKLKQVEDRVEGPTTKEVEDRMEDPQMKATKETWTNKAEFFMAALGAAIGLGNLWRFPYQCYGNGGGAFLIPFFLMTLVLGFPQVVADFSFAQFSRKGSLACWDRVPLMSGIGWSIMIMSYVVICYYSVVVSYGVFYMFASFVKTLPWSTCHNWWNTPGCLDTGSILSHKKCHEKNGIWMNETCVQAVNYSTTAATYQLNMTPAVIHYVSSSEEYFNNYVLQITSGINVMGTVRWPITLCLLFCLLISFFTLFLGVKSWGKVSYVTTLLPYFVLSALLITALTKEGSGQGILYLLTPRWEKLASLTVWVDAAIQAYFSLGASGGFILTLGSHNKFDNNVVKDSIILAVTDTLTSVFCGVVIFANLGTMAAEFGVDVDKVVGQGAGLVFVAYSDMLTRMPGAPIWSFIFNFTLFSLGIGAVTGTLNLVQVNLSDKFPRLVASRGRFIGMLVVLIAFWFLGGVIYTMQGGMFLLQMMDGNLTFVHLLLGLAKALTFTWIYGVHRLSDDIKEMTGWTIPRPIRYIYKFLTPGIICVILVLRFFGVKPLRYRSYTFPAWCSVLSGGLAVVLAAIVPAVAIYKLFCTHTNVPFKQKISSFQIDGMCCAPCTPFKENGDVNYDMIGPYVNHMAEHGIAFAFVNGSTGEGLSMTVEERKMAAETWIREAKGKLKGIIVHIGAGCTRDSMTLAHHAEEAGADAIGCVGPTYFKPQRMEEYVGYMKMVADAAPNTPFYLYDIDIITGITLDCNEFFHAAKGQIASLRGVKHTSPDLSSMQRVMMDHGKDVDLVLGNEEILLAGLALGIQVTVCNSFTGHVLTAIKAAFNAGDMETARMWQNRLIRLGIIRSKYDFAPACASRAVARAMGVDLGQPRFPLKPIDAVTIANLRKDIQAVGFFEWVK